MQEPTPIFGRTIVANQNAASSWPGKYLLKSREV